MPLSERTPLIQDQYENDSSRLATWRNSITNHFAAPISPSSSDFPLTLQCYITGFADSIAYSCTKTWVGFMTGNLTQLSISLSTLIFSLDPRHDDPTSTGPGFEAEWKRIRMSSFSILGFILGCMLSQKLCVMLGDHTRIKLVGASLLRTMITLGVLVFGIVDEGRSLRNSPLSLALLSLTMGSQAIASLKLGTHFSSTVVFTTSLSQLVSDPFFPLLSGGGRTRAVSILALLLGGFSSQSIIIVAENSKALFHGMADGGISMALGSLVGLELLLTLAWVFVKEAEVEPL